MKNMEKLMLFLVVPMIFLVFSHDFLGFFRSRSVLFAFSKAEASFFCTDPFQPLAHGGFWLSWGWGGVHAAGLRSKTWFCLR